MKRITVCLIVVLLIFSACETPVTTSGDSGEIDSEQRIIFVTEGKTFTPVIVLYDDAEAVVSWTFANGETSDSLGPEIDFGYTDTRENSLLVEPWSAVRRINIGYDAGDAGSDSIELVDDQHVSEVRNLDLVAPYLQEWCSSFNEITSLDFSNFDTIEVIECYFSTSLQSVDLRNTSQLRRICFENCNLLSLDLSDCIALEDLRGALNNYPTIDFGSIGDDVFHICVRDNPQFTNQTMFSDTSQFPEIAELLIWHNNQIGALVIPSSSSGRTVQISAYGNSYTSVNLKGALQDQTYLGKINLQNNQISEINLDGCTQINELNLSDNQLNTEAVDQILADLDNMGRSIDSTHFSAKLVVDLRENYPCSTDGYTHAENLVVKGWTVYTNELTLTPAPLEDTGPAQINFITNGDTSSMNSSYIGTYELVYHWSDGTTDIALSGNTVMKNGLGPGDHEHYITISNGAALTRFGAALGGGNGNLVTISGLNNCIYLRIIYVYMESLLTSIDTTNTTQLEEYHLKRTALSTAEMDQIFADIVETEVEDGTIWAPNIGTAASENNIAVLESRGWTIY